MFLLTLNNYILVGPMKLVKFAWSWSEEKVGKKDFVGSVLPICNMSLIQFHTHVIQVQKYEADEKLNYVKAPQQS